MYANLRTNLPVQCMAFPDFPFQPLETSFPGHREVLTYLINYAEHHQLENILFNSPVTSVTRQNKEWSISTPDQAWSLSTSLSFTVFFFFQTARFLLFLTKDLGYFINSYSTD